jgi:hypothetical protein
MYRSREFWQARFCARNSACNVRAMKPQTLVAPPFGPLEAGDVVPYLTLPGLDGGTVDIFGDDHAGHPSLLLFAGRGEGAAALMALGTAEAETVAALGGRIWGIGGREFGENLPYPYLLDREGKTAKSLGLPPDVPRIVALGANAHAIYVGTDMAGALAALERHGASRQALSIQPHPPVLIVPDVLGPEDRRFLTDVYEKRGQTFVAPGDGDKRQTTDFKMRIPEYGRADRIDHYVVDRDVNALIDKRLQRRLYPEIQKAFQYRIKARENFRIACYEGSRGGEEHGHRDNTAPHVAHRRFAVSINLNTEEFGGGALRFPEYGQHRYRPASGDAICFSCSLLHEAMAVNTGRRLVLLAFLFGDS